MPLNKTEKGHLTISLKDWPKHEITKKEPTITTEEIDIWNAEVQEKNRGILRRKQRTQIENWERELQEKLDKCQQLVDAMKGKADGVIEDLLAKIDRQRSSRLGRLPSTGEGDRDRHEGEDHQSDGDRHEEPFRIVFDAP